MRVSLPTVPTVRPEFPFDGNVRVHPSKGGDKDTKVSRQDLTALCDRIFAETASLSGKEALRKAGRILTGWVGTRPHLSEGAWGVILTRLGRFLLKYGSGRHKGRTPFKVFNLNGNEKLPFAAFSSLPVYTCPGAGECAKWCYSYRAWRYPASFARQLQNTLLLRFAPDAIESAFGKLPSGIVLRLYVDGDFGSLDDVSLWMRLLESRPDLSAYGYSKSWDLLLAFDRESGGRWPTNYALNLSTGGRAYATESEMMTLPITRGAFVSLSVKGLYKPAKRMGFDRYEDPEYYAALRVAAEKAGYGRRVFLCPGKCGECLPSGHACGMRKMDGVVIVNGEH